MNQRTGKMPSLTMDHPNAISSYGYFATTDCGQARSNNEDAVALAEDVGLAVLADGMGGYNAGEVASQMVCQFITSDLGAWLRDAESDTSDLELRQALELCVDNANRAVFNAANIHPQYAGMGTTLVVALFRGSRLLLGHVGDSRGYRWRDQQLVRLTRDHSLLQEQIDAGLITPQQALYSAHKNLVTRAVGVEDVVQLETHLHTVMPQDWILLCSDGLSDMLDDSHIAEILAAHREINEAAQALIDAANQAGGRDNIAVILVAARGGVDGGRAWWPFRR